MKLEGEVWANEAKEQWGGSKEIRVTVKFADGGDMYLNLNPIAAAAYKIGRKVSVEIKPTRR